MNKLVICGDSFNIGIGCNDLHTEPYGALLSTALNREQINLAKGSSTNLSIYLQVEYAVNSFADSGDIAIISHTSYDRIDWFPITDDSRGPISNADVNYHQYPPYGEFTYHQVLERHPMEGDDKYNGRMFTENFMGVIDYWETFRKNDKESGYYARFINEPKERMKTLYDFAVTIHDNRINRLHSIGVMTMAHQLLSKRKINHLILTHEPDEYSKFIDTDNLLYVSWGKLSQDYPDKIGSLHTGPDGHKKVFETIMTKLEQNKWV